MQELVALRDMFVLTMGSDVIDPTSNLLATFGQTFSAPTFKGMEQIANLKKLMYDTLLDRICDIIVSRMAGPSYSPKDFLKKLQDCDFGELEQLNIAIDPTSDNYQTTMTSLEGYAKALISLYSQNFDGVEVDMDRFPLLAMPEESEAKVSAALACLAPRCYRTARGLLSKRDNDIRAHV